MATNSRALAKLTMWARMLDTTPPLVTAATRELGYVTVDLIEEGFQRERDPYGQRWAPKKRPDGRPILVGKTRRLSTGWGIVRTGRGFEVRPNVDYAAAHQAPQRVGSRFVRARRMMVPNRSRGLPSRWRQEFRRASRKAYRGHFLR